MQLLVRIGACEEAAVLPGAIGAAGTATAAYGADADKLTEGAGLLGNALGALAFTAATARGATMTGDATVAFALSTIDRALR